MLHVIKFSNGLYKKHSTGYTRDLNEAAIYTSITKASELARFLFANPWLDQNSQVAGCAYKVKEVTLVEA